MHRSTFEALHVASVVRRVEERGGTAIVFPDMDAPFVYILDGPDGPVDLGVPLPRVASLDHALASYGGTPINDKRRQRARNDDNLGVQLSQ